MLKAIRTFAKPQIQTIKGWGKGQLCCDREKWEEEYESKKSECGHKGRPWRKLVFQEWTGEPLTTNFVPHSLTLYFLGPSLLTPGTNQSGTLHIKHLFSQFSHRHLAERGRAVKTWHCNTSQCQKHSSQELLTSVCSGTSEINPLGWR